MLGKKAVTDRRRRSDAPNEYQLVISSEQKISEAKQKLNALKKFTNSRFLQGNLLQALQPGPCGQRATHTIKGESQLYFHARNTGKD